jgi:carbamoyl-phosphate synthase large subunit
MRQAAYAHSVCIMTTMSGAQAALQGLQALKKKSAGVRPIQKYVGNVVSV